MNRFLRGISLYLLIAILAITVVNALYTRQPQEERLNFSEFTSLVEQGRVNNVVFITEQRINGVLDNGTNITVTVPPGTTNLAQNLIENGVIVDSEPPASPAWWVALLPHFLTLIVIVGVWLFILNQMQGGSNKAMSFGKSRAKLHSEEKSKVRFDDVAGLDEAKLELIEIVEFLKHPKRFVELGAKIPKGVLLSGPPGTGKTLLGRAVAGEAGVPFFSISGSDFVEMFVGVGASRVRDLFETAKKNAPCIVFIDELDAVGRQRGAGLGGGHDEREQTLNQLLVEMDGFEPNSGIIIMAATNRPDVLDPALLRPGRFDRKIIVDRADLAGREAILKIHARNKPLAEDVDLKVLAKRTPGFSGADLENLLNEAAILAARHSKKAISMFECEEAIDRVLLGPERKSRLLTEKDKEVFAYHEAGHAVVAHYLPNCDPVHKVTIVGRGMAGGYTMTLPEEERAVHTRADLEDRIAELLGGRAAEELQFKKELVTTGAQNDLERVTSLARKMITEWGMSEELGPLTFGSATEDYVFLGRDIGRERNYSEKVAALIDEEVGKLIERGYERALQILRDNWDKMEAVVVALMEVETLNREPFEQIMAGTHGQPEGETGGEAPVGAEEAVHSESTTSAESDARGADSLGLRKSKPPKPVMGQIGRAHV